MTVLDINVAEGFVGGWERSTCHRASVTKRDTSEGPTLPVFCLLSGKINAVSVIISRALARLSITL